jgi:hypothetical protein
VAKVHKDQKGVLVQQGQMDPLEVKELKELKDLKD